MAMEPQLAALLARLGLLQAERPGDRLLGAMRTQLNALQMQARALEAPHDSDELSVAYVVRASYALQVQLRALREQLELVQGLLAVDAAEQAEEEMELPSAKMSLLDSAFAFKQVDTSAVQSPCSVDAAKSPATRPRAGKDCSPPQKLPPPLYSAALHRLFRDGQGSPIPVEIRGKQTLAGAFFRADDVARCFGFKPREFSQTNGFFPDQHFVFFAKNPDKFLTAHGVLRASSLTGVRPAQGAKGPPAPVLDTARFQIEIAALLGRPRRHFHEH